MKHNKRAERITEPSDVETSGEPKIDTSPYVAQRERVKFDFNIRPFPFTEKQKAFIQLATDKRTKVIFLSGPAGTSKTLLAAYLGLLFLKQKKASEIIYVRTVIESASKSLGFLPGELKDKFTPFAQPLLDKMEELLNKGDIDKLVKDNRIKPIPVNYLRGASFASNVVIMDEFQNSTTAELITALTRIGHYSKFIILGDPLQSDINGLSGFKPFFDAFNSVESQAEGIFCVEFGKEDIMRSEVLKYIIDVIETNPELIKLNARTKSRTN